MNETHYANAKDITAENLRIFLAFWPKFVAENDGAHKIFTEDMA